LPPSRRGEDGHVGLQLAEHRRPAAGGVLIEETPGWGVEHEDQRATVAERVLVAAAEMFEDLRSEGAEPRAELREPGLAFLVGESEVTEADGVGAWELALCPHARVLAREHARHHVGSEADPLPTGDRDELPEGDTSRGEHPHGLVRADHSRAGVDGDALRAPQMVEVGVPDEDPVRGREVVGGEPRSGCTGDPIHVGVEHHHEVVDAEPEGGAAEPIE
jgi:hypothetical protein